METFAFIFFFLQNSMHFIASKYVRGECLRWSEWDWMREWVGELKVSIVNGQSDEILLEGGNIFTSFRLGIEYFFFYSSSSALLLLLSFRCEAMTRCDCIWFTLSAFHTIFISLFSFRFYYEPFNVTNNKHKNYKSGSVKPKTRKRERNLYTWM